MEEPITIQMTVVGEGTCTVAMTEEATFHLIFGNGTDTLTLTDVTASDLRRLSNVTRNVLDLISKLKGRGGRKLHDYIRPKKKSV